MRPEHHKRQQEHAVQPHHIAGVRKRIVHQSVAGRQQYRKKRGKAVIEPRLQKISAGPCGQPCFDKDQDVYNDIGLRAVKKVHDKIQRRRQIVAEQSHAVAAKPLCERIANTVFTRQHILIVIEKVKILDLAV